MIEQQSNSIKFLVFFVASKQGSTGLTVTVDVYNPSGTKIVNGSSASEVGGGVYSYTLSSGSVSSDGEYVAIFKTTDSDVDQQHIPALWVVGRAGIENLDASVSSRSDFDETTDTVDVGAVSGNSVTTTDDFKADVSTLAVEANVVGHVTTALASYDPPTKNELDTAVSTLAVEANVVGHVTTALTSYDPPTKNELDTAVSTIQGTDGDDLKDLSDELSSAITTLQSFMQSNIVQSQRTISTTTNQMVVKDSAGSTIATFNLYDQNGDAAHVDIYQTELV
jgi:hypothetical protein